MADTNDKLFPTSIWLATDSEWDNTQSDPWVSTQFSFPSILLHARFDSAANQFFPIEDEKDFLSRKQRKRTVKGRDVEWFERHRGKGIDSVHLAMSRNQMR